MRVGLIGLGVMGTNHLRVLKALGDVLEVVVYDPNIRLPDGDRMVHQVDSTQDVMGSKLDYLVIASPTATHYELAMVAAKMAIPSLIEKPIAPSLDEARAITIAFEKAGVFAAVGHAERFNSALIELKSKVEVGVVGQVYQIGTTRVGPNPQRIRDVGVVLDLATHDLDLVRWITGHDYLDLKSTLFTEPGKDFEALFVANGTLTSGVAATHNVNWLTPTKKREVSIIGNLGMLVADALRGELRFFSVGTADNRWSALEHFKGSIEGEETKFAVPFEEPLKLQHKAMIAAVTQGAVSGLCTVRDALKVIEVIDEFIH